MLGQSSPGHGDQPAPTAGSISPGDSSPNVREHRQSAPASVVCAVVAISDTRTIETDKSGALIMQLLSAAGHHVLDRTVVPDEPALIKPLVTGYQHRGDVQAVLLTGGTGISSRDQTYETLCELITKPLPGYGELFRMLSFQEIGPAALLSRAVGGLVGRMLVLAMPGSAPAVRLAMEKLILPELGHMVREAEKR